MEKKSESHEIFAIPEGCVVDIYKPGSNSGRRTI